MFLRYSPLILTKRRMLLKMQYENTADGFPYRDIMSDGCIKVNTIPKMGDRIAERL